MKSALLIPSLNIVGRRIEPYVPYGVLSLQAASNEIPGVTVTTAVPSDETVSRKYSSHSEVADAVLSDFDLRKYDLFGLSTVCNSIYHSLCIARKIRERRPSAMIIMGGPYVTKMAPELTEAFDFVDAIFVGESEVTFRNFLSSWVKIGRQALTGPGIVTSTHQSCGSAIVEDLDDLPNVLSHSDFYRWVSLVRRHSTEGVAIPLEATRGCPLPCSFCSTRQIWGANVRRKSPSRLVREMQEVNAQTGDTFFSLIGDNLGVPRAHFLKFCDEMTPIRGDFTWGCSLKLDRFQDGNLRTSWHAGCRAMFVGVESASQTTLDNVRKTASVDNELRRIKEAISLGIKIETSFIIGFPWETLQDIKATYDLHCSLLEQGAHRSQVGILCPIPGTDIVADSEVHFDAWSSYVAQDDLPASDEYADMVARFPKLFSHLGHYLTPGISRVELRAYRDASARIAQLYKRNRERTTTHPNDRLGAMFV